MRMELARNASTSRTFRKNARLGLRPSLKEKAVETNDGVLRKLLVVDGHPLAPAEAVAEERRIEDLIAHPEAFRKRNAAIKRTVSSSSRCCQRHF
jgi:hypothetical protein